VTVDPSEGEPVFDPPWLRAVAAVISLGAGLSCLVLATRVGDRPARLTHAAMGVAMAGMFSPCGDPVPAWAGALGFTVVGAWFAALVLRGDPSARGALHLAIASGGTALMYLLHRHPAAPVPGDGHATGGGVPVLLVVPLALLLAGYFGWHVWTCVERYQAAGRTDGCSGSRAGAPRSAEPVAHGVMSALMAGMLLATL
jgi:hypothetical protein